MEAKRPFVLIAEDDPDNRLIYTEILKPSSLSKAFKSPLLST